MLRRQCRNLKPGGWVEFQCVTGLLRCGDDTVPADSHFRAFSDHLKVACDKFSTPVDDSVRWKGWFEDRGFARVTEVVLKLPTGPWPRDPRLKLIGAWEQHNLLNNLEGMTMRLFSKGLGWSEEEILVFSALLRRDIKDLRMHAYWPLYDPTSTLSTRTDEPIIVFGCATDPAPATWSMRRNRFRLGRVKPTPNNKLNLQVRAHYPIPSFSAMDTLEKMVYLKLYAVLVFLRQVDG